MDGKSGAVLQLFGNFGTFFAPILPAPRLLLQEAAVNPLRQRKRYNVIPQLDPFHLAMPARRDYYILAAAHARPVRVDGELIKSRRNGSLVQASTVPPPLVRIETDW